jgi:hypothetical protein
MQKAIGHDAAMIHESFHCLHSASLSAEMVEVRIPTLRLIPRHQGKALTGLTFLEAGDIAEDEHPPMIRLQLFSAANITRERDIPDHVHLIQLKTTWGFLLTPAARENRLPFGYERLADRRESPATVLKVALSTGRINYSLL